MYKEFFDLNNKVFGGRSANGPRFTGCQQAKLQARLAEAMSFGDSIITVTGPVGCGKTNLVAGALDAFDSTPKVARIARIQLGHDEVLELLLSELGVNRQPAGTIQRFTEFKRLLKEFEENGTPLFIVVEDAQRLGVEGISELESLTSEIAGGESGVSIILMGPPEINDLLDIPELARTKQRILLRLSVESLCATEVRDYLAQRFRAAGGALEKLLESDAVEMIHCCSGGIPRVIDNLTEAVLIAGAAGQMKPITADLVEQVAVREFGHVAVAKLRSTESVAAEPQLVAAKTETGEENSGDDGVCANAEFAAEEPTDDAVLAVRVPSPEDAGDEEDSYLIQDTLPGIKALQEPVVDRATINTNPTVAVDRQPAPLTTPKLPQEPARQEHVEPSASKMTHERYAPGPVTRTTVNPASIKELDDALRPDTHFLQVLEEFPDETPDDAPVPIGLQGQVAPRSSSQSLEANAAPASIETAKSRESQTPDSTSKIPKLSDSMRIGTPVVEASTLDTSDTQTLRKPNIEALETAMNTARRGPIDLETVPQPEKIEQTPSAEAQRDNSESPAASDIPEITLDGSLKERQREAQAQLLATKPAPAAESTGLKGNEKKSSPTIAPALSTRAGIDATPKVNDDGAGSKQDKFNRAKLNKLASDLGSAKSLEEIDDVAAETLFGEEFSRIAAEVAAMVAADSANDSNIEQEVTPVEAPKPEVRSDIARVKEPVKNESARVANPGPAVDTSSTAAARLANPEPAVDTSSTAAARLALVQSMNGGGLPEARPLPAKNTTTGSAENAEAASQVATKRRPAVTPIENQFGASMTQTLEALNPAKFDADTTKTTEDKKRKSFLGRFRPS